MAKYSKEVIDDLLQNLDALDVLELIDFHPESIQREGDFIRCYCPLCQSTADRYLTINLRSRDFTSTPPDMPSQSGNIIDLFARVRRISLEQAIEELAEEFGVLLMEAKGLKDFSVVLKEGLNFLKLADEEPANREAHLREAEKRFSRVAQTESDNIESLKGIMEVRLREANPLTLAQATLRLIGVLEHAGEDKTIVEVAQRHLKTMPDEVPVRRHLAESLARLNRTEEAVREFMSIAEAAEKTGQIDDALVIYRRVQQLGSEVLDTHPLIVSLLMSRGRKREALAEIKMEVERLKSIQEYRQASVVAQQKLRFDSEDDETRIQVIELAILSGLKRNDFDRCLKMIGEMTSAGRDRNAAEALSYLSAERADDPQILSMLIDTYRRLGEEDLVTELEYRLIDLYVQNDEVQTATAILNAKIVASPEDLRAREAMAMVRAREGETKLAIRNLHELIDLHLINMDDKGALRCVQKLCEIQPDSWEDREREVEMLFALGDKEEAEACLMKAIPDMQRADQNERLISLLESHLKRDPDHFEAIKALSLAYDRKGNTGRSGEIRKSSVVRRLEAEDFTGAESVLKQFLEDKPDDPELLDNLAELYSVMGRKADARKVWLDLAESHGKAGRHDVQRQLLIGLAERYPNDLEILSLGFAACERDKDDENLVEIAEQQIELMTMASDFKGALEKAEAIIARRPDHEGVLLILQKVYGKLGRVKESIETGHRLAARYQQIDDKEKELEVVRELHTQAPNDLDALDRLIILLAGKDQPKELEPLIHRFLTKGGVPLDRRISVLKAVTEESPNMRDLRLELIGLLRTAGREEEMLEQLEAAVEAFEAAHDREKLLDLYKDLLRIRPDNLIARARLVDLLRASGKARECMTEHLGLARQYRDARRLGDALSAYERMYEFEPRNEAVLSGHASLLREMGRREAATRKLKQLATILAEDGNADRAIQILRDSMTDEPEDEQLRLTVIELLRNSQRFEEAAKELHATAQRLFDRGEDKAGIASLREAVAMMPESIELREELVDHLNAMERSDEAQTEQLKVAEVLSRQGQPQKALAVTERVLDSAPASLTARQLRAQIFDALGDEKRALAEYREMQQYIDRSGNAAALLAGERDGEDTGGFFPGLQILEEYDFDNFIVGSKNQFAYATARAVAAKPGQMHNPLFLYSDVGLGKTHLLQAIANECKLKNPDVRILYASTEYFTTALVEAIQNNTITIFRTRHRKSDILLLDDVQFLAGKERSQEEFFHIFNILHQDGRQIVVTSDRPPKDIAHLDMRIRSRFAQGVIVDIQPPDFETRIAILRAEAGRRGIEIPMDAITVIAERINTNIRELKGAFNQLLTQHEMCGDVLSSETAHGIVDKFYAV